MVLLSQLELSAEPKHDKAIAFASVGVIALCAYAAYRSLINRPKKDDDFERA